MRRYARKSRAIRRSLIAFTAEMSVLSASVTYEIEKSRYQQPLHSSIHQSNDRYSLPVCVVGVKWSLKALLVESRTCYIVVIDALLATYVLRTSLPSSAFTRDDRGRGGQGPRCPQAVNIRHI